MIPNLQTFSEKLERYIYRRISNFLIEHEFMGNYQLRFIQGGENKVTSFGLRRNLLQCFEYSGIY